MSEAGQETVYLVFGRRHDGIDIRSAYTSKEAAEEAIERSCSGEEWRESYQRHYRVVEVDLHDEPQEFRPYL